MALASVWHMLVRRVACTYIVVIIVFIDDLGFEWEPKKDATNQRKHGVSFEEAKSAFSDERGRSIADSEHSDEEDRFVLLGMSNRLRLLIVVHCYRYGDTIRIISARKATRDEKTQYESYRHA